MAEEAGVGVVEEAAEDKTKEIEIKVKMGLPQVIPPGGMGKNNDIYSDTILKNVY